MRWRYAKVAFLGALLGFAGQLLVDFFFWDPTNRGQTLYAAFSNGMIDGALAERIQAQRMGEARALWYRGIFLIWLQRRGEAAGRMVVIAALIAVSLLMAAQQLREKRKVRSKNIE